MELHKLPFPDKYLACFSFRLNLFNILCNQYSDAFASGNRVFRARKAI